MKIETIDDVAKLIEHAKEAGLSSLEMDNFKIRFSQKSLTVVKTKEETTPIFPKQFEVPDVKSEEIVKSHAFLDDLTPEEILYYATPHFDEIQAQKEEQQKRIAEESV